MKWLIGKPDVAFALAREYPPDAMRIVQKGMEKSRSEVLASAG